MPDPADLWQLAQDGLNKAKDPSNPPPIQPGGNMLVFNNPMPAPAQVVAAMTPQPSDEDWARLTAWLLWFNSWARHTTVTIVDPNTPGD